MPGLKLEPVDDGSPAIEIQGDRATIGRTAGVDHIVNDSSVSRQHAVLELLHGSWTLTDSGSSNGTFVEHRRITTSEIRDGQEISFGTKAFRVHIDWMDAPTAFVAVPDPATAIVSIPERPLPPAPVRRQPIASAPPPPPPPPSPTVQEPPPIAAPPRARMPRASVTAPANHGVATATVAGLWRDANQLVMVKGARLPDLCVKCGEPGTYRIKRSVATFLSPFQRADVLIRLCERHRKQRTVVLTIGGVIALLVFVLIIGFVIKVAPTDADAAANVGTVSIRLLVWMAILGGAGSWVSGGVRAARIHQSFVWLKGIHENILHQVPLWPGETAAFAEVSAAGAFQGEPPLPEPTRLSTAAMIAGCLSIFMFPAPVAAVLGILSILDLRIAPGRVGMGRSIFGLVAGLIGSILLAVVLVSSIASDTTRRPAPRASTAPVVKTVTITSKDGTLRITAPWGWRSETELNKIAELQACDPPQQVCLVVIREARTKDTVTLERFSRVARGLTLKNLQGGIESAPLSLQVDGHGALQYELRGTINQINLAYLHTSILTPTHYYQAIGWTSTDAFPREKAVLSGITSSFHAVEAP